MVLRDSGCLCVDTSVLAKWEEVASKPHLGALGSALKDAQSFSKAFRRNHTLKTNSGALLAFPLSGLSLERLPHHCW